MQFLPQDKVVEFAKLKPVELLLETEKAVGDSTLYDIHQNLIRDRNQLKGLESVSPPLNPACVEKLTSGNSFRNWCCQHMATLLL